jgi:hypothetical protein
VGSEHGRFVRRSSTVFRHCLTKKKGAETLTFPPPSFLFGRGERI